MNDAVRLYGVMRCLGALALLATPALAAPVLDPMFSDHAVIQRGEPIKLRGSADPGERVVVGFAGRSLYVRADKLGRWAVDFPAMRAGGPYRIQVTGSDSQRAVDDIMIGDVWLCSGQSNMEFPLRNALNGEAEVAAANDPQLRLLKLPHNRIIAPQESLMPGVGWKAATPDSAQDFSAACYFMTRALRQSHGVAIGAIDSTWGGTAIHAWMDEAAVRATGGGQEAELLRLYGKGPNGAVRSYGGLWANWWRARSGDKPGAEPWHSSDRLSWRAIPTMTFWEQWGDPELTDFDGAMWTRVRFTLTAAEAGRPAVIHLGAIDDFDRTFINGHAVGQTYMYDKPRDYKVAPGLLKPGTNEIVVYILDTGGGGGFWGPAEKLKLTFASGAEKPLGQGWQFSMIHAAIGTPPLPPWGGFPGPTTLYNGMIAPLGPVRLKGVAWYQGEADVGKPGYDVRLAAMMKSWRARFGQPDLPFLIVGLAGFGRTPAHPGPSNWAALIDEQRKAADRDRRASLVSAIDIGERDDIHPPNKQEVARRLTVAADALAYGEKRALTPKVLSAERSGPTVIVRFDQPLERHGGDKALVVELCGSVQESCRYAMAEVDGSTVRIVDDAKPATRVRYAWADYPIVNLYGTERLPVPPFEIAIRP